MVNKKIGAKIAFVLVTFAVLFTACKSMPAAKMNDKFTAGMELAAWKGEWVSADIIKDNPSLKAAYKKTAADMRFYTPEGLEAAALDMYKTPAVKAKFDGTNTVLFTSLDKDGKEMQISVKYKYLGQKADSEYSDSMWETFEAVEDKLENANFKYFISMPPHAHGDGPKHWHARFGRYSIDNLVAGAGKWPTYYSSSTSEAELVKMFESSIPNMPKWNPASPFESYAKHGKWINSLSIFENTSKEVEAAYAKVIKEFAGKNPKGGDFTKAEIIAELQKGNKSVKDYSHMEFIVKDGKNELVFYKGDKEIFRSSYVRVAASTSKPYMTMKAERKDAGMYSLISFVVVHGKAPMLHFHLWYGNNEKEIEEFEGTPTCYRTALTDAEIAAAVEKSVRNLLEKLTKAKK